MQSVSFEANDDTEAPDFMVAVSQVFTQAAVATVMGVPFIVTCDGQRLCFTVATNGEDLETVKRVHVHA